jgi:hypothetical protein
VAARPKTSADSAVIKYHGGPLILGTINVYYIWYGDWTNNTAKTILTDFANHIGGSQYFAINSSYYDQSNTRVKNSVHLAGSVDDSYSRGKSLLDSDIEAIVDNAINNRLPLDANGVYFVLTSADVTEGAFCGSYCGWHTRGTTNGKTIKYAFVGNPDACPGACSVQTIGPNGNAGADGMASVIAHELEEAVTDPEQSGWFADDGEENADLCAWTFGDQYVTANGASANISLGGRDFLIQQNWENFANGFCTMTCTPSCNGKRCGAADGCGGVCACARCGLKTCLPGQQCCDGVCKILQVGDICD